MLFNDEPISRHQKLDTPIPSSLHGRIVVAMELCYLRCRLAHFPPPPVQLAVVTGLPAALGTLHSAEVTSSHFQRKHHRLCALHLIPPRQGQPLDDPKFPCRPRALLPCFHRAARWHHVPLGPRRYLLGRLARRGILLWPLQFGSQERSSGWGRHSAAFVVHFSAVEHSIREQCADRGTA